MSTSTPYAPPRAAVADRAGSHAELKMFSVRGRIGRVRYIAWSFGVFFVFIMALGLLEAVTIPAAGPAAGMALYFIGVIAMTVISVMFGVQRLHDLDKSGWMYLLMFVPIVSLFLVIYLMAFPGTQGANRFGNPPPPNSTGVVVTAWLVPVFVIVLGILAAIAIPAYQQYVERAKAAQMQQFQQQPSMPPSESQP